MFKVMRIVFLKEVTDLLRDRRSLFFLFAVPLLTPLFTLLFMGFVGWQVVRHSRDGLYLAVSNPEAMPALIARLEEMPGLELTDPPPDLEDALAEGDLMAHLMIPPDAQQRIATEEPVSLDLTSSPGGWLPDIAVMSIQSAVDDYGEELVQRRLDERGLDETWMEPLRLNQEMVAPRGVAAASAGTSAPGLASLGALLVPLTVASWAFSGGLNVVISMTLGEKVAGTMEALLVTPANRVGLVLGKIALSIIISGFTVFLWSLDSLAYFFVVSIVPADMGGFTAPLALRVGGLGSVLLWLVLLMLPLMTMVNAILAAVGTFAKNYREASLFLSVIQLSLPALATVAVFVVDARPPAYTYALPLVGTLVAVRDLFQGGVAPQLLMFTCGVSVVYALLAILWAAYVFSREWALMRGL
jgi:sodium transport system permease protein